MRNLQKFLSGSRAAALVAVRRVTQVNQGKRTAGIDGKIYSKDVEKEELVSEVQSINWDMYRCSLVRRVYIPKPRKIEKRPLGIPTIKDRVLQMVVKLALEPEWECKFEQNSYGFRPGRRCMDAIWVIHAAIAATLKGNTSAWIFDADIEKCFDRIDHEALLKKLPMFTNVLRRWLKAGAIEFGHLIKTKKGTPQGGIISPLLANIALDGMDRLFGAVSRNGNYIRPSDRRGRNKGIVVIRYADDFVILAPSREILIEYVIPRVCEFLAERGLALKGAKTRIVHREQGFEFLGFRIQQHISKYAKLCAVTPTKDNIKHLLGDKKDILMTHKQTTQAELIDILNPRIRGWAYYYRYCHAKRAFVCVDSRIFRMLWWWARRRHKPENKGAKWVKDKYFPRIGSRKWTFADKPTHPLFYASTMRCDMREYRKVKGEASPFDPALEKYWSERHGEIPQFT